MIVSNAFLRDVQSIYDPQLIQTRYARRVADWCISFYAQYQKAPQIHIVDLLASAARANEVDEDEEALIERLLDVASKEYERADKFNAEYLLKQTETHFTARSLTNLSEDVKTAIVNGDTEFAHSLVTEYRSPERPAASGFEPLTDEALIKEAYESASKPLFNFSGALGDVIGGFARDSFTAFFAPHKRGKTWWLQEIAVRALLARCNVALFDAGDMTKPQRTLRMGVRTTGRPYKEKYAGERLIPILDCKHNQNGTCKFERSGYGGIGVELGDETEYLDAPNHKVCTRCQQSRPREYAGAHWWRKTTIDIAHWTDAFKAGKKFARRAKGRRLKMVCYATRTLTVQRAERQLDRWEDEDDFVPDVCIFDYPDLMAVENMKQDKRHQEDEKWANLRRLSQERSMAVIGASQTDTESFEKESIGAKNFSEARTKIDHVTSLLSMNQTPEEKRKGLLRIGQLVAREDAFDVAAQAVVLQCLQIGRPVLGSYRWDGGKK